MRLKNKQTGEIGEASILNFELVVRYDDGRVEKYPLLFDYTNLEYYKEPKEYWRITDLGELKSIRLDQHHQNIEKCKQIGNYFETKEEAEKAVEKLKAFKRLEDKGFRFIGKTYETDKRFGSVFYKVDEDTYSEDIIKDLDLLFSDRFDEDINVINKGENND